jgi:hypothetical protein
MATPGACRSGASALQQRPSAEAACALRRGGIRSRELTALRLVVSPALPRLRHADAAAALRARVPGAMWAARQHRQR